MSFSERLKELRQANNMSQVEFANRIGIRQSAITAYERDLKFPGSANLIKIAEVFNVSVDYLLGLTNVKERNIGTFPEMSHYVKRPTIDGERISDEELKVLIESTENLIKVMKKRKRTNK